MTAATPAFTVTFPLRGEWVAAHTPAARVPSHGTDALGQRYAYDFLRIEPGRGWKFFRGSALRYWLVGVTLDACPGWRAPIHAPFAGTVIAARDGWPERRRLHPLTDLALVLTVLLRHPRLRGPRTTDDLRPALGNYIILKMPDREVYAFLAHAHTHSVRVHDGDAVACGQHLADVGHSGNSTAPHLHFQLMDRADIRPAQGLPCDFARYEALRDGAWRAVTHGMPGLREFIRHDA